jgi:hypothetical protein
MATATMALKVTDGTTTVDLVYHSVSNPGYQLSQDWAPQIAPLRRNELGGHGPYEHVVEDIPIRIFGTSAADAYSKAHTLNVLLDQAERWWLKKQSVNPVKLYYSPPAATVSSIASPLRAIILGRADNDDGNMLTLPPTFNKGVGGYVIDGIHLKLLRRGAWSGASDNTGASGSAANATVLTQAFGVTHPTSSPLSVEIGGFNKTSTPTIKAGYLCVGSQSSDVQVVEAEGGTAAKFTSVNDAANLARGNNVLRYTPTDVLAATSGSISLTTTGGAPVAVIAAVRNNSATTTWLLHANLSGTVAAGSTPDIAIDASSTQPRLVLLGTVVGNVLTSLTLTVTASAASGTLDIDFLIVVNLRDETCAIVANDDISLANLATSGAATLDMGFSPTSDRAPQVYAGGTAGLVPASYRGALPFQTIGQNVYALWTAPNGQYWRFTNTSNAIVNVTLNVSRDRAYLIPQ